MDIGSLIYLIVMGGIGFVLYWTKIRKPSEVTAPNPKEKVELAKTAQDFALFEDVADDMIRVDSRRYRAVLELEPINLAMYSFPEQLSIKERFRRAMVGIRFPFSFYFPSLRNNPKRTIQQIVKHAKTYSDRGYGNLAAYGSELAQWVEYQTTYRSPLEPGYYIVINYDELKNAKGYKDEIIYQQAMTELNTRCQQLMSSLGRAEIRARRLKTNELTNVLYFVFNRDLSDRVNIEGAIKSGMFGLFTTAADREELDEPETESTTEHVAAAR